MDHKLIIFTALFVFSGLLFSGLPEGHIHPAAVIDKTAGLSGDALAPQPSSLAAQIARLQQDQARLHREMKLLRIEVEKQSAMTSKAEVQESFCTDTDADDEPSGVTVYLESPSSDPDGSNPQWTAVSFREAGVSPSGSKQAVFSIHTAPSQNKAPVSEYRSKNENWQ